jgi:hypothetical protein
MNEQSKPPFGDPAYRTYVAKYASCGWDIPTGAKKPPREPEWVQAERIRLANGPTLLHPIHPLDIGVHRNKNLGLFDFHTPPLLAPQRRVQMSPVHAAMRKVTETHKGLRLELKPIQKAPIIIEEMRPSELLITSEAVREQQRSTKPIGRGTGNALAQMRALQSGRGPQPFLLPRGPESTRQVIQSLKLDLSLVHGHKKLINTTAFDAAHHEAISNSLLAQSNGSIHAFREIFNVYDKLPLKAIPDQNKPELPQSAVRKHLQQSVQTMQTNIEERTAATEGRSNGEAFQLPDVDSRNNNAGLIPRPLSAATRRQMRPPSATRAHQDTNVIVEVSPKKIPSPTKHAIKDEQVFSARNIQIAASHREAKKRRNQPVTSLNNFFIVGKKAGVLLNVL